MEDYHTNNSGDMGGNSGDHSSANSPQIFSGIESIAVRNSQLVAETSSPLLGRDVHMTD